MGEADGEDEWLARAARGDERAFARLYERHRGRVYGFLRRLLGADPAVDDILQACFLSLFERPQAFRADGASLGTYLCAAARNLAFRHLRRAGRFVDEDQGPPEGSLPASALTGLLERERADAVARAVAELPVLQREVVVLFEYEQLSLREIAEIAGVEVGAVKARLHRARGALRRRLAGWLEAQEEA